MQTQYLGVASAAGAMRRQGIIDAKLQRKMLHVDAAYQIIRRITEIGVGRLRQD